MDTHQVGQHPIFSSRQEAESRKAQSLSQRPARSLIFYEHRIVPDDYTGTLLLPRANRIDGRHRRKEASAATREYHNVIDGMTETFSSVVLKNDCSKYQKERKIESKRP